MFRRIAIAIYMYCIVNIGKGLIYASICMICVSVYMADDKISGKTKLIKAFIPFATLGINLYAMLQIGQSALMPYLYLCILGSLIYVIYARNHSILAHPKSD